MKQKTKLPDFKEEDELAAWVEANDTSDVMDELAELGDEFEIVRTKFSTKPLEVRIRTEYWEAIEELAVRRGVPYQALVQRWLLEKLNQEAPDLMTK